jgi:hypothetical protein
MLKSVLRGFLGTYASRYSDFDGYWLFGYIVGDLGSAEFDLLAEIGPEATEPGRAARTLAAVRFSQQLAKAGLAPSQIVSARLYVERLPGTATGAINGHPCSGYRIRLLANATADTGRCFECERLIFVAPHNPRVECRSGRAGESGAPNGPE